MNGGMSVMKDKSCMR